MRAFTNAHTHRCVVELPDPIVFTAISTSCLGWSRTRRDAMGVHWNAFEPLQIGIMFVGCLVERTCDRIGHFSCVSATRRPGVGCARQTLVVIATIYTEAFGSTT